MSLTVYMFHAIGDLEEQDWADPHYSYSWDSFEAFLSAIPKCYSIEQCLKCNIESGVVVTFDDGHISNYEAAKKINELGKGKAEFFINPELIGNRYYMSWEQVAELHELGMSIQSHGLDHQYLSDCSNEELFRQLSHSKNMIESRIGNQVTVLAPPGGRFDNRTLNVAQELGYAIVANSEPGIWSNKKKFTVPRVAVLKHHSVDLLLSYQNRFSKAQIKEALKYRITRVIKLLLGNKKYEQFRNFMLGASK